MDNANEKAKEYLKGYRNAKRAAELLRQQIAELQSGIMNPSQRLDGMPRSRHKTDLSDFMARFDGLMQRLESELQTATSTYNRINEQIQELPDDKERELVSRRYLLGADWGAIALEMNYSYRHILKIHGSALKHFAELLEQDEGDRGI